ncbi:MAG: hypothetical protein V1853_00655 [bacterium]
MPEPTNQNLLGSISQKEESQHKKEQQKLLGYLRMKRIVFSTQLFALAAWFMNIIGQYSETDWGWYVIFGSIIIQGMFFFIYGVRHRQPGQIALAPFSVLLSLFFWPYYYLNYWLSIIGIACVLLISMFVLGRSQPLPTKKQHIFAKSVFAGGALFFGFVILWFGGSLMASSIYPLKQTVVDDLTKEIRYYLDPTVGPVIIKSKVNIAGRYYFSQINNQIKYYDKLGQELKILNRPVSCTPPYPMLPGPKNSQEWACRSLETQWIFIHDHETVIEN